jgi:predicted MPP superfamily phosphohydrolase
MTRRRFLDAFAILAPGLTVVLLASCVPPRISPPGEKPTRLRFGIITDLHYADIDPSGARSYRESLVKLDECIKLMNEQKVDFLIELGDLKDQDRVNPTEAKTLSYLRRIEGVFQKFDGPRYHVLGNHDVDSLSKSQFLKAARNSGILADKNYYSFSVRGVRFIVLDANFRADGAPYDRGNFTWEDANIPAAELSWMKQELASSSKPAIIFIHQQLDGEGDYSVKNAAEVRHILERSGKVLAVIQGHRHEGQLNIMSHIPFYTLKAVVEGSGAGNNSYALVEIDRDFNIMITGFRKAVSLRLPRYSGSER